MKRSFPILFLAWTATLAGAWWLGRGMSGPAAGAAAGAAGPSIAHTGAAAGSAPGGGGAAAAAPLPVGFPSDKFISYFRDAKIPVKERVERLAKLEDPVERMASYLELLKSLGSDAEMEEASGELAKNFDGRSRGREMSMLMTLWAQRNPEAALEQAGKFKDWAGRYATDTALSVWAKADPNSAKTWAAAHNTDPKGEGEGNWHMISVIGTLAKTDLDTAISWAQAEPRSKARGEMMDRLVDNFEKQRGLDSAKTWAQSLPEGPFREGVLRKVAWELTEENPAKSAQWLAALPAGSAKAEAMNDLVDHWAERNPNEAGEWLRQFSASPEMDGPRRSFAWEIREKDPESAVAWAGAIQNQKTRDKMMVELMRDWTRRDKNAAQAYMQRNSWPEAAVKKVAQ